MNRIRIGDNLDEELRNNSKGMVGTARVYNLKSIQVGKNNIIT